MKRLMVILVFPRWAEAPLSGDSIAARLPR